MHEKPVHEKPIVEIARDLLSTVLMRYWASERIQEGTGGVSRYMNN